MNFQEIATPFVQLGIPVFPLSPKTKIPPQGLSWLEEATTDLKKVEQWNQQCPDYNVALVANGEFCFLEFDVPKGMSKAAEEMGQEIPLTRTQKSGKGFGHYIFRHTERSRKLGNRSVNLPGVGGEWFSFRADNKYLVGAGSLHPSGNYYKTVRDIEPIPVPDWVCDFVEKHGHPVVKPTCIGSASVSEDFDFDDFCEHYGISILGVKDDVWQVVEECPGVGYRHEGSTLTGFYYDGETLGWNCFAQGCPTCGMSIGQLIKFLNMTHEPYDGVIWEQESDEELLEGVDLDELDAELEGAEVKPKAVEKPVEAKPGVGRTLTPAEVNAFLSQSPVDAVVVKTEMATAITPRSQPKQDAEDVALTALVNEMKVNGELPLGPEDLLPEPTDIAIADPQQHEGLEFPGQCAMYGRLAQIAMRPQFSKLPMGWFWPTMLVTCSVLDIEDRDHFVRSNEYGALLGDVGTGKTFVLEAARQAIHIPDADNVICEDAPGSHSGLINQLSEDEPLPRLLAPDELKVILNSCNIQGSNLAQMLCTLWNKDKTGGSVKKGRQIVYGKLSIIGGLACKDSAEFARLFGSATVSGLADRFLLGYHPGYVKARPVRGVTKEEFQPKPVFFPDWVWDAKDKWIGEDADRRRLSEHALRVALITAACNGDLQITKPCLEAAFRFAEWQQRLRKVFKPGLAESKDAEALEAVWTALKERFNYQKTNNFIHPEAAAKELYVEDYPEEQRWKFIHFTDVLNSKSYYRKYGRYISGVRKTLIEEGFIREIKEDADEDENGKKMGKPKKTPFIVITKIVM